MPPILPRAIEVVGIMRASDVITGSVRAGDWARFDDWIMNNSLFTFNYGTYGLFPGHDPVDDRTTDELIAALLSEDVLRCDECFKIVDFFQHEWDRVSPHTKDRLLQILEYVYLAAQSSTARFLIAELLGEYYSNQASLGVLHRLDGLAPSHQRHLIAYGYGLLARYTQDASAAREARGRLRRMCEDPNPDVREQAEVSLARLD